MIAAPVTGFVIDGDQKVYTVKGSPFAVPLRYEVVGLLGTGSYGVVCAVADTATGERLAVKQCTQLQADDRAELALREMEVLDFVLHRNVLSLTAVLPTSASASAAPGAAAALATVYAATPLLDTSLATVLRSRQVFQESHRRYFAYQLVCGMHYLHSAGIIHADLKPANLLVNLDCSLKIGDFGLAQLTSGEHPLLPYVVTAPYRAPELLLGNTAYGPGIDVWAAGCIVAELYKRQRFFTFSTSRQAMLEEITQVCGAVPEDVAQEATGRERLRRIQIQQQQEEQQCQSGEAAGSGLLAKLRQHLPDDDAERTLALDFIGRMLEVDPRRRATAAELLRHPYIAAFVTTEDLEVATTTLRGTRIAAGSEEEALRRAEALEALQLLANRHNPTSPAAIAATLVAEQEIASKHLARATVSDSSSDCCISDAAATPEVDSTPSCEEGEHAACQEGPGRASDGTNFAERHADAGLRRLQRLAARLQARRAWQEAQRDPVPPQDEHCWTR